MHWLLDLAWRWLPDLTPSEDGDRVARREAELRQRFERLSQEVDVIQRNETDQEPRL